MNLEVEATYENGTLKLGAELPLQNGQRVKVTVHQPGSRARASAGIFPGKAIRKTSITCSGRTITPGMRTNESLANSFRCRGLS